jgi:transcriptional regulator with XRE-family HTH domain
MAGHPVDRHVGARLRLLRLQRGLSQSEVAGRVGLTFQQLQKYEKGSNRVSASKLFELAAVLNVPVQDFFEGASGNGHTAHQEALQIASRVDIEILQLMGQIDDGPLKRNIRGLLQAVVARPHGATRPGRKPVQPS